MPLPEHFVQLAAYSSSEEAFFPVPRQYGQITIIESQVWHLTGTEGSSVEQLGQVYAIGRRPSSWFKNSRLPKESHKDGLIPGQVVYRR